MRRFPQRPRHRCALLGLDIGDNCAQRDCSLWADLIATRLAVFDRLSGDPEPLSERLLAQARHFSELAVFFSGQQGLSS